MSATRGRVPIQTPIGTQIDAGDGDQHDDAGQRGQAEQQRRADVGAA